MRRRSIGITPEKPGVRVSVAKTEATNHGADSSSIIASGLRRSGVFGRHPLQRFAGSYIRWCKPGKATVRWACRHSGNRALRFPGSRRQSKPTRVRSKGCATRQQGSCGIVVAYGGTGRSCAVRPNHSFELTRYGRPAWPGRRYFVYFRRPGQTGLPHRSAQFKR